MTLQNLLTNSKESLQTVANKAEVGKDILYQIRNGVKPWHSLSVWNYMAICKALKVKPTTQLRKDMNNV